MGVRKRVAAAARKENSIKGSVAHLRGYHVTPRKVRLVTDLIRNKEVNSAIDILRFTRKKAAKDIEKLLLSAVANWMNQNEETVTSVPLMFINEIFVGNSYTYKRFHPGSRGKGRPVRKECSNVTVKLVCIENDIALGNSEDDKIQLETEV